MVVAIAGPLAGVALAVPVTPATPRTGKLVQVGPIAEHGFPAWYRDSNDVRLEACYTLDDPLCPTLPDEVPEPGRAGLLAGQLPGRVLLPAGRRRLRR